jgi:CheY-like chemotaxis protein
VTDHTGTSVLEGAALDERATAPPTRSFRPLILGRPIAPADSAALAAQRDADDRSAAPGPAPSGLSEGPTRAPRAATPATLLVVDDDENLARMLRRGLAFAGYTVRVAPDGETALRLTPAEEPDPVVLDVMLPGPLDGLEVARRLRAGGSDVPVLMLTALDDVAELLRLGPTPAGEDEDIQTLGGVALANPGRVPRPGDRFAWRGRRFQVVDMDGRRANKLLALRPASAALPGRGGAAAGQGSRR